MMSTIAGPFSEFIPICPSTWFVAFIDHWPSGTDPQALAQDVMSQQVRGPGDSGAVWRRVPSAGR